MVTKQRLELLYRLRRNNNVMAVKVENAFPLSIGRNQTDGAVVSTFIRLANFQALAFEAKISHAPLQKIRTGAIILPRWILRWNGNKLRQQRGHLVLALPQP